MDNVLATVGFKEITCGHAESPTVGRKVETKDGKNVGLLVLDSPVGQQLGHADG